MPIFGCSHGCRHCPAAGRRQFLKSAAATVALGAGGISFGQQPPAAKPRVAVFFLSDPKPVENWPWPGWNPEPREKELIEKLVKKCPGIDFEFFSSRLDTIKAGMAAKDRFDGVLAYLMTLGSSGSPVWPMIEWQKPMVLGNYMLGGCAPFLTNTTRAAAAQKPLVSVSTERDDDLIAVVRCFERVKRRSLTAAQFAEEANAAYRATFGKSGDPACAADALRLPPIGEVLKKLRESRILVVGAGKPGTESDFFGAKVIYLGFDEFDALCKGADADAAQAKADGWIRSAENVVEAQPDAIRNSARVAIASRKLLEKYRAETVTMNCLGGFAAGKLMAYPCLGFTELLDEGRHGVCEAQVPDSFAMIVSRALTGRSGFVSDPTLDTSTRHIIYAHCMAPTKMLGTEGNASPFRIRTLHNRDPRGACVQSFMPPGYMTTSFRVVGKTMLVHQAKSVGNYDSERGCRSQLLGEIKGDPEKLMRHWQAWHRVTVYGDIREPLKELAAALKLTVIEEG